MIILYIFLCLFVIFLIFIAFKSFKKNEFNMFGFNFFKYTLGYLFKFYYILSVNMPKTSFASIRRNFYCFL